MSWTAPMTAVANATFTAAQFNTHVRDNLQETAPAKATTAGRFFATTGANAIAERVPNSALIATAQATGSNGYVDLTTPGPAVTVTTGTLAFVAISGRVSNDANGQYSLASFEISGATSRAAGDQDSFGFKSPNANDQLFASWSGIITGMTAGSNTFTMKYKCPGGGNSTFANRRITVIPF